MSLAGEVAGKGIALKKEYYEICAEIKKILESRQNTISKVI